MNIIIECLKAYPESIYEQEIRVIEAMNDKNRALRNLNSYLLGVEQQIAKNSFLKNDTMRKAAKQEFLFKSEIYQELSEELEKCDRHLKIEQLELEKIKNEFSVAKIEARTLIEAA